MKERVKWKSFYLFLLLLLITNITYSNNTGAWITWTLKPPSVTPPVHILCREVWGSCLANHPPWDDSHRLPWEDCPSWRLSSEDCWAPQWIHVNVRTAGLLNPCGREYIDREKMWCWAQACEMLMLWHELNVSWPESLLRMHGIYGIALRWRARMCIWKGCS